MFLEGISSLESYITKQGKKWGICWQFYHGKKVEESCWNLCGGANLLSSCLFPAFVKRVELSLSHSSCGVAPRGDFRVTKNKKDTEGSCWTGPNTGGSPSRRIDRGGRLLLLPFFLSQGDICTGDARRQSWSNYVDLPLVCCKLSSSTGS